MSHSKKKSSAEKKPSKNKAQTQEELPRYSPMIRLGLVVLLIGGALALCIPISIWWQERPLRAAESKLADKPNECIQQVDDFLKEHPSHPRALGIKARAFVRLGAMDAALAIFHVEGAYDTLEWHAWAVAHIARREWRSALPLLREVLKEQPNNSDAIEQITACLAMTSQFDEAMKMAQRLVEMPGYKARGLVRVGMIERDRLNIKVAIGHLEEALKLADKGEELSAEPHQIQLELGKLYIAENRTDKAVSVLETSLKGDPRLITRAHLAQAYRLEGNIKQAVSQWKLVLELDALDTIARAELARVSLTDKRPDQAMKWLLPVKSFAKRNTDLAELMYQTHEALKNSAEADEWSKISQELKHRDEREAKYAQVVNESPESFWGRVIRAWRFADQSHWNEAKRILSEFKGDSLKHSAVKELNQAIENESSLPTLESLVDFTTTPKSK
jgi:tetratricopeptide (TPR) repeat protein